ncbi:phage baseplate assembly protein V [Natronobiforma cellulositropha]|uniref:phage baseplate assembly protein V n=1 Tax=Natronobiforma cellulositropha TaxID=1679076 RepID=UPI0021D5C1E0|nr:phage baseplate assembly protein V [Natronobiforma cellulositropha]
MDYENLVPDDSDDGLHGVYVGTVTDNEDPEDLARVRVTFPWRDLDDESNWARLATPMAGEQRGVYALPEVGEEVLVAFEEGDIHSPYVIGGLWNGKAKPPEKNTDGENNRRLITSRAGHEIVLDDEKGEEKVEIQTPKGKRVVLEDEETVTITDDDGSTITLDSKGITLKSDSKLSLSGSEIELKADQDVSISGMSVDIGGSSAVDIESKGNLGVDAGGMLDIGATGMAKIQSSAILTIKGSLIQLN